MIHQYDPCLWSLCRVGHKHSPNGPGKCLKCLASANQLLGEWKLIQASAFWGLLAWMVSALKIVSNHACAFQLNSEHFPFFLFENYSGILISCTLIFFETPDNSNPKLFPLSSVKHCDFTPDFSNYQIFWTNFYFPWPFGGLKNQDSTVLHFQSSDLNLTKLDLTNETLYIKEMRYHNWLDRSKMMVATFCALYKSSISKKTKVSINNITSYYILFHAAGLTPITKLETLRLYNIYQVVSVTFLDSSKIWQASSLVGAKTRLIGNCFRRACCRA